MKRILTIAFIMLCCISIAQAQSIEVGLRDNNYAHACYKGNSGWLVGYEQSLLNVRLKEQSGRLFAGYEYEKPTCLVRGVLYGGTEYTGAWQSYGAFAEGCYNFNRFYVDAILNPHYDTGLDFKLCYQAEAGFSLWQKEENHQKVELCASYGNIPEYRMAERNLRAGVRFTSGILWVKPMVSLPDIDRENGQNYLRVICSFGWSVEL